MDKEYIYKVWLDYKGRIIGLGLGLLIGILILLVGFWKMTLLLFCMLVGYWLGGIREKRERFMSFLDRILPKG